MSNQEVVDIEKERYICNVQPDFTNPCNKVIATFDFSFTDFMEIYNKKNGKMQEYLLEPIQKHATHMDKFFPGYYDTYFKRLLYDTSAVLGILGGKILQNDELGVYEEYVSSALTYPIESQDPLVYVFRMHKM